MSFTVIPVRSRSEMNQFVRLPWKIYKGNKNWVPPLIKDFKESLDPAKNTALQRIDHELFLALKDGEAVGRIFAGIDHVLNEKKQAKMAHFALFECVNDHEAAGLLFDAASNWLRERNISILHGPVSITGTDGDEYKGLLIDCFDRPPVLMTSYNPPYYQALIESHGFAKEQDLFAYYVAPDAIFANDPAKAIAYAEKKYNFHADTFDLKNIEKEIRDIKHVLDLAVPEEWPDLVPPSLDDVRSMAERLKSLANPDLVIIVRSGDEAVGFGIAMPDYNQVLINAKGRMGPLTILKLLRFKNRFNIARFFVLFVVPAFRKKGVSYSLLYNISLNAFKHGVIWGEGSTIGETNTRMRNDMEKFGGKHYKTYRVFSKEL